MSDAKLLSEARLTEMEVSCADAMRWAVTMEVRPNAYKEQVGSAELAELIRGYRAHLAARELLSAALDDTRHVAGHRSNYKGEAEWALYINACDRATAIALWLRDSPASAEAPE